MRVAFVTTIDDEAIEDDVDLDLEKLAFAAAGLELHLAPWEDESVEWTSFDLVVVRTPWNYVEHLPAFRRWLAGLDATTRLWNPAPVIEWNLDKRYLLDLSSRGVAIVPTAYIDSVAEFRDSVSSIETGEFILKPSISAGSRLTGRFSVGDPHAESLAMQIIGAGLIVMVQPLASSVDHLGEIGTVVFDGEVSHSFRKGPILASGGELIGGAYREDISPIRAPDDVLALVREASAVATDHLRAMQWMGRDEELLYARFDVVRLDDRSPALLEAELFEPCFFLPTDPAAVDRFVTAVLARLAG